jgi:hypothetical protein
LTGIKKGITSGETVLLGEALQLEHNASRTQNLQTIESRKGPLVNPGSLSIQLPSIFNQGGAWPMDQRNVSLNKVRSEATTQHT